MSLLFRKLYASGGCRRAALLLFTLCSLSGALDLKYIPVLPPVITNPSLGQIDLFGEGFGSPIFIISLNNSGDTTTYEHLRMRYSVTLEFTDNNIQRSQRLYEGLTGEFSIGPNEVANISSTRFMNSKSPDSRFGLKYMEYELDDVDLKERLIASKRLPDGTLTFALELFPSVDRVLDDNSFTHTIINATSVDLITPGNEIGQPPAVTTNPRPVFSWISQLPREGFVSGDPFELRLYEARPGVSASEAVSRPPFFKQRLKMVTFQYPADAPQLVPGYTYYWQVTRFLEGAYSSEIQSDIFGFLIEPLIDSTAVLQPKNIDYVLEMLRPIIGDAMVEEMREYVSGDIRIDNASISREQLATLLQTIMVGQYIHDEPSIE